MQTADEQTLEEEVRPVVVVIGNFSHEGLTAKIEAVGFRVINRNLRSTAKNWLKIIELLRDQSSQGLLAAVFVYMPTTTLLQSVENEYDEIRSQLVAELAESSSIVFVHEENLQGSVEPFPWEVRDLGDENGDGSDIPWPTLDLDYGFRSEHGLLTTEEWKEKHKDGIDRAISFLADLSKANIDVAPFRKRSDVTIRIFEALEESQAGIFLRLYVPHGRYQSEQFEDFLTLFSRYLREVEKKEFSIDANRTSRGTTYVFKGRGDASSVDDLQAAVKRFDDFLHVSEMDPIAAGRLLEGSGLDSTSAQFLVAKYSRQMKRLKLDIKHEYERKRLLLGQALEVDVLDGCERELLPLPEDLSPSSIFSVIGNSAPVTINFGNGLEIASGGASIQKLILGDVVYTEEDKRLIDLISTIGDQVESLKLRSELERLKDSATPPDEKRTAAQKLKSFLYASGKFAIKKIDEVGTKVLVSYLEKLCGP